MARLPYDVPLPRHVAPELWEFQRYVALMQSFEELDTSGFDLMVSTQPPSLAVQHERHLSVFSHHHRIYYDLADVHVAAGFADPELHDVIAQAVRRLDQPRYEGVSYFLAASEEVKGRLERFNGLTDNVLVYHAGVAFRDELPDEADSRERRGLRDLRHPPRVPQARRALHPGAEVPGRLSAASSSASGRGSRGFARSTRG